MQKHPPFKLNYFLCFPSPPKHLMIRFFFYLPFLLTVLHRPLSNRAIHLLKHSSFMFALARFTQLCIIPISSSTIYVFCCCFWLCRCLPAFAMADIDVHRQRSAAPRAVATCTLRRPHRRRHPRPPPPIICSVWSSSIIGISGKLPPPHLLSTFWALL